MKETRFATVPLIIVTVLTAVTILGMLLPHRTIATGPRTRNLNNLSSLAVEIARWQDEHETTIPSSLAELDPFALSNLGMKTNTFFYLGTNGERIGIIAIEKRPLKTSLRQHWTDSNVAVLRTDLSACFVETNTIPAPFWDLVK